MESDLYRKCFMKGSLPFWRHLRISSSRFSKLILLVQIKHGEILQEAYTGYVPKMQKGKSRRK